LTSARLPATALVGVGIPRPFRVALQLLARLPDQEAAELVDLFGKERSFQTVSQLQALVPDTLSKADAAGAQALIPCLLSLGGHPRAADDAAGLASSISLSPDLELENAETAALERRLNELLKLPAIESTARAIEILTQNPHNYESARVLTDVRHVFSRDVGEPPRGATIVEVLQLHTWSPDGVSDITYVAMDEADLLELRSVINRALEKTATLRKAMQDQQLSYFQLDRDEK
jgi:prophage DNA circulation protein